MTEPTIETSPIAIAATAPDPLAEHIPPALQESWDRQARIEAAIADRQVVDLFGDLDILQRPVEPAPMPKDEEVASIAALAVYLGGLDAKIEETEKALKELGLERKRVAEVLIPKALLDAGVAGFTLADGREVAVDEKLVASISAENQPAAFQWLYDTGADDLIKTVVKLEFGRGENLLAETFLAAARGRWPDRKVDVAQNVHSGSLAKHLRELEAKEQPFPEDVLGVYRVTQAVIREPKVKKPKGSKRQTNRATDTEEF